jgi:hypothetical protein
MWDGHSCAPLFTPLAWIFVTGLASTGAARPRHATNIMITIQLNECASLMLWSRDPLKIKREIIDEVCQMKCKL